MSFRVWIPVPVICLGFAAIFQLLSCGGGGDSSCCSAGVTVCEDGIRRTCNETGTDLTIASCPSGACLGNECMPKQCEGVGTIGSSRCDLSDASKKTVLTCTESGTEFPSKCGDTEECVDGTCQSTECSEGSSTCGSKNVLTCTSGTGYSVSETCSHGSTVCDEQSAACVPVSCAPGSRECSEGGVLVCTANGNASNLVSCGSGKTCKEGACVKSACVCDNPPCGQNSNTDTLTGDGAGNDGGGIPDSVTFQDIPQQDTGSVLKPPSTASVTIDGSSLTFTAGKVARWVPISGTETGPLEDTLQLTMAKGAKKIEILLVGITENQVGEWTEVNTGNGTVEIRWSDGFTEEQPPVSGCSNYGWTSCAATYTFNLTTFGAVGERVIGSFESVQSDGAVFTEGTFDLERKQ